MELEDSEDEEEVPIKWWDNEIKTLIAISSKMKEEFIKSTRKQSV